MKTNKYKISGNIVDVVNGKIYKGEITVENGIITQINNVDNCPNKYIIPGLIDAHVHIESSMVTPANFAEVAVVHGTVATVSDPHEIANVLGVKGIEFMIKNGKTVPFKFFFGAPSCVPATPFESSGAIIDETITDKLLSSKDIYYLAEMMNYPGVIYKSKDVISKINSAHKYNKPIDGHAPNVSGEDLSLYAEVGITTDHECMNIEEAIEKIKKGIKIQIREGSAAKNFDDLLPLIDLYPEMIMFCSDDKHPDDLLKGHINLLVKRAINRGYDPITLLKICSKNVIEHYKLNVGLLQKNDAADFVIIDNLTDFNVLATYINGEKVSENGKCLFKVTQLSELPNNFNAKPITENDIKVEAVSETIKLIKVDDGQLYTYCEKEILKANNGFLYSNSEKDILKIVVLNRYLQASPAVAFIRGFGLKTGAIASSIAHDSHNIVAVGVEDENIVKAINSVIECKGGISVVNSNEIHILPLPIAGLMSAMNVESTAKLYKQANEKAINLGTKLKSPFMTLAFMSLLVIPELKLGDKGLFDGLKFQFTSLFD